MKRSIRSPFIASESGTAQHINRLRIVLGVLLLAALGLVARAVDLQLMDHTFLSSQGDARYMRVQTITAHRGTITDRYGEPLAVSTPVDSVWANPQELTQVADRLPELAKALGRSTESLARRVSSNTEREFLYLARHLQPEKGARIKALGIPGVYLLREYRRYYPAGEVAGHLLGFTSIDDNGQEGLELAYDHWLAGENGAKRIIQDRYGRVVENLERVREVRPGKDLVLSIDLRIQYLAYRELKRALIEHRARAGSLVMLDVQTGEVLAMVNQPAFNPNDREQLEARRYRNRAVTDMFEPGSSIKPFVLAAALASGRYQPESTVDTSTGPLKYGRYTVSDKHPLGVIDLTTVLAKSSNVAMAKVALDIPREQLWQVLDAFGFGQVSTSGFPGESAGLLSHYSNWRPVAISSMSHGYSLSVTPLQLARGYAVLGAGGIERPITFLRAGAGANGIAGGIVNTGSGSGNSAGTRVLDADAAASLVRMLEAVVAPEGTGTQAALSGYRVAGKTGTAWKAVAGGYSQELYVATFAGLAPASRPRLACVVMIDEPRGKHYYGGEVAAPAFAAVMAGALRLLAVAPDDLPVQEPEDSTGVVRTAVAQLEAQQ